MGGTLRDPLFKWTDLGIWVGEAPPERYVTYAQWLVNPGSGYFAWLNIQTGAVLKDLTAHVGAMALGAGVPLLDLASPINLTATGAGMQPAAGTALVAIQIPVQVDLAAAYGSVQPGAGTPSIGTGILASLAAPQSSLPPGVGTPTIAVLALVSLSETGAPITPSAGTATIAVQQLVALASAYGNVAPGAGAATVATASISSVSLTAAYGSLPPTAGTATVAVTTVGGATAVSDNFNRTNASTLGANWTKLTGVTYDYVIDSNRAAPAGLGNAGVYWSANSFAGNHYSEAAIFGATYVGVAVRMQSGANSCYAIEFEQVDEGEGWFSANYYIVKVVAGSKTRITSAWNVQDGGGGAGIASGTIVRLEAGTSSVVFKTAATHGGTYTTRLTASSESSLSGGAAGLYQHQSVGVGGGTMDDWYGGDL